MMKARRGVFGGTAGLWLLRKKHRKGEAAARTQSTECSVALDDEPCRSKKESWIGWDDERCRPVYNDDHSTASTQPSSNNSVNGNNNSDTSITASPPEYALQKSPDTPKESLIKMAANNNKGRRRVFAVRKRHYVPVTETHSPSPSSDASSSSEHHPSKRIRLESSSSGIKSSSSSKSEFTERNGATVFVNIFDASIQSKDGDKDIPKLSQESESSSVFDFEKQNEKETEPTEVRQPGHQTSLDVARAFFEQLDSDQTLLTLEDVSCSQETRSGVKQSIVKTTRGKLPPKVAQTEYRKYCTVCRGSKVKPLPMERFLEQRGTYFRRGDVFDGMFDE